MERHVAWKPLYSVGHAGLDDQHKQILDYINDLYVAMDNGSGNAVVKPLLDRMINYTNTHFKFEEQLMRECGYPELEPHKQLHETLRRKTAGLRGHAGLVLDQDLLYFLKDWWISHIQEEDQRYAPYVSAAVAP